MPKTADEHGLANPFDPEEAIPKSAELLADLKQRFGNLGLAAAAYNAGAARVANWLVPRVIQNEGKAASV
jgi:soluble lytic murein transglycosylase-like protein